MTDEIWDGTIADYDQAQAAALEVLRDGTKSFFVFVMHDDLEVEYWMAIREDARLPSNVILAAFLEMLADNTRNLADIARATIADQKQDDES